MIKFVCNLNKLFYAKASKFAFLLRTLSFDYRIKFKFNDQKIKYYTRGSNINHPPFRITERSIELALADMLIKKYKYGELIEVGAVTPFCLPNRVKTTIYPYYCHTFVSNHAD